MDENCIKISAIPTPDSTPVKDSTVCTQVSELPVLSTSNTLLSFPGMTDVSVSLPNPMTTKEDTLHRPSMPALKDTSAQLPIQTIQQNALTQLSIHGSKSAPCWSPNRLSHLDCCTGSPNQMIDLRARFEQATYLRGRPPTAGGLKLTEPTPCLDTKEITGRGITRSAKRAKKTQKTSGSNKKQNKGSTDPATNHLLGKVRLWLEEYFPCAINSH